MNTNDRKSTYDGGHKRTAEFSDEQRDKQRERRIEQRRAVLNDPDLPHEIHERAHRRMCELQREGEDE